MLDFLVVTPVLNGEAFIRDCILSVKIAFKGSNYLHLVVDGGSEDRTSEVLRQNSHSNLKAIDCPGTSMYEALNIGLNRTRARIFYQLNADDLVLPHAPPLVMNEFSDSSVSAVTGICMGVDLRTGKCRIKAPLPDQFSLHRIGVNLYINQPATFVRHDVLINEGGYSTVYQYASDTELWLRLIARPYNLRTVNSCLAVDRLHSGSVRLNQRHDFELRSIRSHYTEKSGWCSFLRNTVEYSMRQIAALANEEMVTNTGIKYFGLKSARLIGFFFSNTRSGVELKYPFLTGKFSFRGRIF